MRNCLLMDHFRALEPSGQSTPCPNGRRVGVSGRDRSGPAHQAWPGVFCELWDAEGNSWRPSRVRITEHWLPHLPSLPSLEMNGEPSVTGQLLSQWLAEWEEFTGCNWLVGQTDDMDGKMDGWRDDMNG